MTFSSFQGEDGENFLDITCSSISFIGQSKDKTTIRGEIGVENKKNVTVKSLTLTNPNGHGFGLLIVEGEEASVEMMGVSVKGFRNSGMSVESGASVKATQCEFSETEGMEDQPAEYSHNLVPHISPEKSVAI